MIYLTGDTHGDFRRVAAFCDKAGTTKDDILIVLGDAGLNFQGNPRDKHLKQAVSELPVTLFCIHGNHEKRPESIGTYKETAWHGCKAYVEPEFPSLIFAKDGEIYDFDGKRCIVIGGAYSVDKPIRLLNHFGWWPDEQPSEEIKRHVEAQLDAVGWKVDIVFSHTCPSKYVPTEVFLPGVDQSGVDNSTEIWLNGIEDKLTYSRWYCGHWHTEKTIDKLRFMFNDFIELHPAVYAREKT